MNIVWNEQQQLAIDYVRKQSGNVVIDSTAGSGKTTLLNYLAQMLSDEGFEVMSTTFTDNGTKQLKGDYVWSTTIFGRSIFTNFFWSGLNKKRPWKGKKYKGYLDWKYPSIIRRVCLEDFGLTPKEFAQLKGIGFRSFIDYLRNLNAQTDEEYQFAWELSTNNAETELAVFDIAKVIIEKGIHWAQTQNIVDFVDAHYIPHQLEMVDLNGRYYEDGEQYDLPEAEEFVIFVDEYQDLTPSEFAFLKMYSDEGARLIFIGDSDQTIMGFRGTLFNPKETVIEEFGCTPFEIDKTLRCPTSHTQYVRDKLGYNIWSSRTDAGFVLETNSIADSLDYIVPGDTLFTARNFNGKKAPIIPAIKYILENTDYTIAIKGINIEHRVNRLLKKMRQMKLDVHGALLAAQTIIEDEEYKLQEDDKYFVNLLELQEQLDFAVLIVGLCVDCVTVEDIKAFVAENMSSDNASILFSTVFQIKGEQYETVVYLDPQQAVDERTHPLLVKQEENIGFVACTRGKENLILVNTKGE